MLWLSLSVLYQIIVTRQALYNLIKNVLTIMVVTQMLGDFSCILFKYMASLSCCLM